MVEKVGNLLMFPAFHNVEQSDQKSGFQKDMYSLFYRLIPYYTQRKERGN